MTSRAWHALLLASAALLSPAGSSFAAPRQGLDGTVYADSRLGPAFRRAVRTAATAPIPGSPPTRRPGAAPWSSARRPASAPAFAAAPRR